MAFLRQFNDFRRFRVFFALQIQNSVIQIMTVHRVAGPAPAQY